MTNGLSRAGALASPEATPRKTESDSRSMRVLAALGALCCAIAVGAGAYAMHATLTPQNHQRFGLTALFLFAHGLALAALAPRTASRVRQVGLCVLLLGTLLFTGSLACAALLGMKPVLAPFGGGAMMFGWVLVAVGFVVE